MVKRGQPVNDSDYILLMSVELLAECKRKLIISLNKLDKTVQMFDS